MTRLVLRADASVELGTGHVMRLLAIAEAARDRGWTPRILLGRGSEVIVPVVERRGMTSEIVDAETGSDEDVGAIVRALSEPGAIGCITDGYDFGPDYFASLASRLPPGAVSVAIDDQALIELDVDLVVNPNYGAASMRYRTAPRTRTLLGTHYTMLRSEFRRRRRERGPSPPRMRLLVTFGGADHTGTTARVIDVARRHAIDVVAVGGVANRWASLSTTAVNVTVLRNVADMAEVMSSADAAISASGQTLWELAYFGIPTLAFCVATNQEPSVSALGDDRKLLYGGWAPRLDDASVAAMIDGFLVDAARREDLGRAFGELVDGRGVDRVLDAMEDTRK